VWLGQPINWSIFKWEQGVPFISSFLLVLLLMAAIKRRAPGNIERYLWAVLVQVPAILVVHLWYGDESPIYACTYVFFTFLILYTVCRIALDCLRDRQYPVRAIAITFLLALISARIASFELQGRYAWISLSEGFLLLWAGLLTAFTGAYRPRRDLYFALGLFWLFQSAYSFGWSIKWQEWAELNWLVPPLMAIGFFSYLTWRLRY
jgi:hypothetical protein